MIRVDVVVHRFGGVLEVVVVNVLGDAVEEEGVGEHGGHVGDVPVVDISGAAVVLQHIISLNTQGYTKMNRIKQFPKDEQKCSKNEKN